MSLFNFSDLHEDEASALPEKGFAEVNRFEANVKSIIIKNRQKLIDAIGDIKNGEDIFFINQGRWSAHDLLLYLLSITGPAALYFTAWAVSENAARLIQSAVDNKLITEVHCVLDRRIEIRNDKVIATVRNFSNSIVFVDCHAKLFVLENDNWKVTILTTANLSNNLRIEAGHIYTNSDIATLVKNNILKIIKSGKPFEDE